MYFQLCVESARENIIWEDLPNYLIILLLRRRECDLEYISKYHVIGMYTVFASFSRPGEFARPTVSIVHVAFNQKGPPPPGFPFRSMDRNYELRAEKSAALFATRYRTRRR